MIAVDEDSLICDLAETYHIYNYRSLPVKLAATFSVGLRQDSRIMMKLSRAKLGVSDTLAAIIADRIGTLVWFQSEDGAKGRNRPESILDKLLNGDEKNIEDVMVFDTGAEFEAYRKSLLRKEEECQN